MSKKKPVNLDLWTIHFPIPAIISILHRISGFILFLSIPLFLWLLDDSLRSADAYAALQTCLAHPFIKLIVWGVLSALVYHVVAGVRHLIMDLGYLETKEAGRLTAKIVLVVSVLFILVVGIWLW